MGTVARTIAAIAVGAALCGMITVADAQNAPTTQVSPSPASVNKSSLATKQSGSESRATATHSRRRVAGHGRYCRQTSASGRLDCFYGSMRSCHRHAKSNNLRCVTNPNRRKPNAVRGDWTSAHWTSIKQLESRRI